MPRLWLSSSSSVIIGRKMSCSSKRKRQVGSCIKTFVSSTNSFVSPDLLAARDRGDCFVVSTSFLRGGRGGSFAFETGCAAFCPFFGAALAAGVDALAAVVSGFVVTAGFATGFFCALGVALAGSLVAAMSFCVMVSAGLVGIFGNGIRTSFRYGYSNDPAALTDESGRFEIIYCDKSPTALSVYKRTLICSIVGLPREFPQYGQLP